MAVVTVTIPNLYWVTTSNNVRWDPSNANHLSLGPSLSEDQSTDLFLGDLQLPRGPLSSDRISLSLSDGTSGEGHPGPEFSTQMETEGTITFIASSGASVVLTGISDSIEPYAWIPSNNVALRAFGDILGGLSDQSLTVIFDDHSFGNMKYNGTDITAAKFNDVDFVAAKFNDVTIF